MDITGPPLNINDERYTGHHATTTAHHLMIQEQDTENDIVMDEWARLVTQQECRVPQEYDGIILTTVADSPKDFADQAVEKLQIPMERLNEWDLILGQKANGRSNSLSEATKLYRNMRVAFVDQTSRPNRRDEIATFINQLHESVLGAATAIGEKNNVMTSSTSSCFWMAIRIGENNKVNTVNNHNDGGISAPRFYQDRIASFKSRNGKTIYCRAVMDCHQALLDDMDNLRPNKRKNQPSSHNKLRPHSSKAATAATMISIEQDEDLNTENLSNDHLVTKETTTKVPSAASTTTCVRMEAAPATNKTEPQVGFDDTSAIHLTTHLQYNQDDNNVDGVVVNQRTQHNKHKQTLDETPFSSNQHLMENPICFEDPRTTGESLFFMSGEKSVIPRVAYNDVSPTRKSFLQPTNNSHSLMMLDYQFEDLSPKVQDHQSPQQQQLQETPPPTTAETTTADITMTNKNSSIDPFMFSLKRYMAKKRVNSTYKNIANNSLTAGSSQQAQAIVHQNVDEFTSCQQQHEQLNKQDHDSCSVKSWSTQELLERNPDLLDTLGRISFCASGRTMMPDSKMEVVLSKRCKNKEQQEHIIPVMRAMKHKKRRRCRRCKRSCQRCKERQKQKQLQKLQGHTNSSCW